MAQPLIYKQQRDVQGFNGFGLPFSNAKYSATLAANTDTTLTVPNTNPMGAPATTMNEGTTKNRYLAIIQTTANASVWVALNETAAAPAGGSFASTTSDLIIGSEYYAREVAGGDVIHFKTAASNVDVSVQLFALPAN